MERQAGPARLVRRGAADDEEKKEKREESHGMILKEK
jgi:hypothetical protein